MVCKILTPLVNNPPWRDMVSSCIHEWWRYHHDSSEQNLSRYGLRKTYPQKPPAGGRDMRCSLYKARAGVKKGRQYYWHTFCSTPGSVRSRQDMRPALSSGED